MMIQIIMIQVMMIQVMMIQVVMIQVAMKMKTWWMSLHRQVFSLFFKFSLFDKSLLKHKTMVLKNSI